MNVFERLNQAADDAMTNQAFFRGPSAIEHPRSMHSDKPHIWFFEGFWRCSLWNRRQLDLHLWLKAHGLISRLNRPVHLEGGKWVGGLKW